MGRQARQNLDMKGMHNPVEIKDFFFTDILKGFGTKKFTNRANVKLDLKHIRSTTNFHCNSNAQDV